MQSNANPTRDKGITKWLVNSPVLPTPLPPTTAIFITRFAGQSVPGYSAMVDMFWTRRILTTTGYSDKLQAQNKYPKRQRALLSQLVMAISVFQTEVLSSLKPPPSL